MIHYDELPSIEREILRVFYCSPGNSLTVKEIMQSLVDSDYQVFVAINSLLEQELIIPYSSTENIEEGTPLNPSFYPVAEILRQIELKGEPFSANSRQRLRSGTEDG